MTARLAKLFVLLTQCALALCAVPRLDAQATSAASVAPAQAAPPVAGWKPFAYPADGFTASFPSEPALSKQSVPTAAGAFELHSYLAQDGPVALIVGVCDYRTAPTNPDPDVVLQGAKAGALVNTKSHLLGETKITLGSSRGIAFEAETESIHFSSRIYLAGNTLYQVLVAYPIGAPYTHAVPFLDSFQLTSKPGK
jgi:hypothetical protein